MDDAVKKSRTTKGRATPAVKPESGSVTSGSKASAGAPAAGAAAKRVRKAAPKATVATNAAAVSADASAGKPAARQKPASQPAARKPKLVRGSFAVPKDEYAALAELKQTCLKDGVAVKKSQLLRVAITLLRELDSARLGQMVAALPATAARRKKNK
jgi:hypothetical protein